jgi:hypothetical protein
MTFFEHISSLRINYHKSDLTAINLDEQEMIYFAKKNSEKLKREDIQPVVNRIITSIPGWKGKLFSYSARLTLLKACLASISIYLMPVIKFPKWAIGIINSHMSKFF